MFDLEARQQEPPAACLRRLIVGYRVSQAIYVAAKFGVADILADGPLGTEALARSAAADEPTLRRLLRGLAAIGLVAEEGPDRWTLTPLGDLLRSDVPGSLRDEAILYGERWTWQPWGELLRSVQTGEAAFPCVFGMTRFEFLETHPEANSIFNAAMSGSVAASARAVAGYDLTGIETLVDIGGGNGATLVALLQAHLDLRGVLFDRPHVVAGATDRLAEAGVEDRCAVVAGDFFVEIPTSGDAYLLRHVLHNWDDRRAQAILAVCRRAMAPTDKLLVEDSVVAASGPASDHLLLDLHMLVSHGGRERTIEEFQSLFAATGFELTRAISVEGSLHLIEGVPI